MSSGDLVFWFLMVFIFGAICGVGLFVGGMSYYRNEVRK